MIASDGYIVGMKKPLFVLIAAVVPVAAALVPLAASASAGGSKPVPAGSCAVMPLSAPSGTTVEAVTAMVARYTGHGDPASAKSYHCVTS